MLSSIVWPPGSISTGTVPLGEAASITGGFSLSRTSRNSQRMPLTTSANLARIA